MNLLEIGEYMIGEPVYEVKASPKMGRFDELTADDNDTIFHKFYEVKGFDFMGKRPDVHPRSKFGLALKEALDNFGTGYYYCLIKQGTIVSMQWVREISHVRMVED